MTVGNLVDVNKPCKCMDPEIKRQFVAFEKIAKQDHTEDGYKTEYQSKLVFRTGHGETIVTASSDATDYEADVGVNDYEYNSCEEHCQDIELEVDNAQRYTCEEGQYNEEATLLINYGG